ncbi:MULTISPECIES: ComEA family DNA-binding protein [Kocuria]|uniref:ComE operon protein 1 n=1 Tax=Kocuria varians TaxID=1272 RepID=A0A7D7L1L1_KOCVA|nr:MULTISPECIES: ComEA family DNA-binding protein [Kocuria]QMS57089.1 ComE operon protein 1 [Kocuria varians]RUP83460.1 hypothetical protein D8M39_07405 [Kocuria sp. HSID17590]RUQ12045.1 hypothetical protein D8M38_02210 [Kocuria sp. HSID17582]
MSGIDVRGRRRFRDSQATERLAALLGEDGSSGAAGGTTLPGDDNPAGDSPAEEARSRHREDVLVRRRLSRPAVVVLCVVLLLAVALGGISLLSRGDEAALVTSAAVSGEGTEAANDDEAPGDGARAGESSGASTHGRASATSHASSGGAEASDVSTARAQDTVVLTVHVVGEVKDPSVVTLSPGARVMDAVQAAGGFTSVAVKDRINLAQPVQDGAQITIPNKTNADRVAAEQTGGTTSSSGSATAAGSAAGSGAASSAGGTAGSSGAASGGSGGNGTAGATASGAAAAGGALVNLNTATAAELETLPRVGPVLAQRIVDFRTQHGPFTAPEQLDDVSGVGPALLEALLPLVSA